MFGFRRKGLPISTMLMLEDQLSKSELHKYGADKDDDYLAAKFNLEVVFVNDHEMEAGIEAKLAPPIHDGTNGTIYIRESLRPRPFAFTHELMHYVFDVGVGNVVSKTFTRKARGEYKNDHEQQIDYQAAANRMRYDRMVKEISNYDTASPRMNSISFVNHLCSTYKVDSTSAIRRVQEVRAMMAQKKS